ncbi:hypothetical protein B0H10DRAFT_2214636 [Mycena sp. CBHHK59/15]|nr:hypothetical protein B0H10DRAFT_2214636 [Mycena sp. CBHHK59/15]
MPRKDPGDQFGGQCLGFCYSVVTLALGMLSYKYVHIYEKWSWIPTAITFFIVLGCAVNAQGIIW